jgi:cytoskeletal protein RodZ
MIGIHARKKVTFMATVLQHPFGRTTFGDFLRSARERRGLTIQQIANETKIPRRLLESLEHGDLAAVPAGMYQRAEIRAYAKAVGLDPTIALSELERALGTSTATSDWGAGSGDAEAIHRRPFLAAALAVAIALIGIVAWYGRMTPLPAEDGRRSRNAGAQATPARGADQPPPGLRRSAEASAKAEVPTPQIASGAKAPPPQTANGAKAPLPQQAAPGTAAEAPLPQAAAAAGLVTELVVVSDPPGARVVVDGIGRGTTPVTIRYLSAGEKRVRVLRDGFPAEERTVRLAPARQPTTVVFPLQGPGQ